MPASSRNAVSGECWILKKGFLSTKNQEKVVVFMSVIKAYPVNFINNIVLFHLVPLQLRGYPLGTSRVPQGASIRPWVNPLIISLITVLYTTTFSWFLVERKPFFYIQHSPLTGFLLHASTLSRFLVTTKSPPPFLAI